MKKLNDYFNDEKNTIIERSLSYSRITDFAKNGPKALVQRSQAHGPALSVGRMTDDFLNEFVDVNDIYYVYDGVKPSATLGKLCNVIIDHFREVPSKEEVLEIIKKNGYWSNIVKEDVLATKFDIPEFWEYITLMIKGRDKEIVTSDLYFQAKDLAHVIRNHKNTKHHFSKKYERIYQYFFEIKIRKVVFRGAIDYIKIDHKKKTVEFIDFKTGKDSALNFSQTFVQMRYFIQEAIYSRAFKKFCSEFKLKGYKKLPFQFIYVSKKEKVPLCYIVSNKWHKAALKGFTTTSGYTYRGLYDLIDDVIWHYNNRIFDMPRYLYETDGTRKIDDTILQ